MLYFFFDKILNQIADEFNNSESILYFSKFSNLLIFSIILSRISDFSKSDFKNHFEALSIR